MASEIIDRLPLPLAQVFLRARNSSASRERHDNSYYYLEAGARFLAAFLISDYLSHKERDGRVDASLSNLSRPSVGQWVQALRTICSFHCGAELEGREHVREFARSLSSRSRNLTSCMRLAIRLCNLDGVRLGFKDSMSPIDLFNLLPAYRNRHMGHGAAGLESFYAELGGLLLDSAREVAATVDFLARGELVYAEEKREIAGDKTRVELMGMQGGLPMRLDPLELATGAASLWRTGRLHARWRNLPPLGLFPLLKGSWADERGDVAFFNSFAKDGSPEYLSYSTGKVERLSDYDGPEMERFRQLLSGGAAGAGAAAAWEAEQPRQPTDEAGLREAASGLERLERMVGRLVGEGGKGSLGSDELLQGMEEFVHLSSEVVASLQSSVDRGGDGAACMAFALSIAHMARMVESFIARCPAGQTAGSPFQGVAAQLQKGVLIPVSRLRSLCERGPMAPEREEDFFSVMEEGPAEEPVSAGAAIVADLLSEDPLKRHEAVLALVGGGLQALLDSLPQMAPAERDAVFSALWEKADVLLVETRGGSRAVFEAASVWVGDPALQEKWGYLYFTFKKVDGSYWDADIVRMTLAGKDAGDNRIFGRCFLLHPRREYRLLALELLEPVDFWEVIADPRTPVDWQLELWRFLKGRVPTDYLKVFLVCVRDSMLRPGTAERLLASVELLKEFFSVDSFHEDTYFKILMGLDAAVKEEARRHHLLLDLDQEYSSQFKAFASEQACMEQPVGNWSFVPLPVQRRLASRGFFLKFFATHPVDVIAMECLRHLLVMDSVMEYISNPSINGRLITELAKERRLFLREEAKYALVANPKTPTYVVLLHISYIRKDHLKKLSESREVNQFSRQFAAKLLERTPDSPSAVLAQQRKDLPQGQPLPRPPGNRPMAPNPPNAVMKTLITRMLKNPGPPCPRS